MPPLLVLVLVIVPLAELVIVIQVGQALGVGWTLLALVATSVLGLGLLQRETRRTWREFRVAMADGRRPGDEVVQGALAVVGGALLLAPGFLTDVVGLLCLLPPTRRLLAALVRARLVARVPFAGPGGPRVADPRRRGGQDRVVGEVEVLEIRREDAPDEDR